MRYLKYIKKIGNGVVLSSLLFSLSCSLERNPLSSFSEDTFWTSEENAMLALTGLYKGNIPFNQVDYNLTDWWSYTSMILLDGVSDIGYDRRGFNNDLGRLTSGALISTNGVIGNLWKAAYKRIEASNRFLQNIDNVPGLTPEIASRLKAEARFIRATQYFYLGSYFHNVPLVDKLLTLEEANTVSRSSREEVLAFVVKELEELAPSLPLQSELPSSEIGRANRQAAWAFIGRTHMLTESFSEAATALKQIVDQNDSSIAPAYTSLFTEVDEHNNENIFSVQFVANLTGNGLPQHAYPAMYSGWCILNPAAGLFENYAFDNGDKFSYTDSRFDEMELGKNRDPRLDYTIYYHNQTFKGTKYICAPSSSITSSDKLGTGQVSQTGYMPRKYLDESYAGDLSSHGSNVPVVRYADVLLMYLEAVLESGTPVTQTLLDLTINAVRARADVNMPAITDTNTATLRDIIRDERMIELAFEGHRLWDLFRWGIAEEKLNNPVYGAPFGFLPEADIARIRKNNGVADPYFRWYSGTREFNKSQQMWPIPQSEQNINPNLRD